MIGMADPSPTPPAHGLDRIEKLLFLFGVLAFAVLMLAFGQPLGSATSLPIVAIWIVGGLGFIWWFDRHMAHRGD
jgi:hypothetical protein